jgi:hypothetical protein
VAGLVDAGEGEVSVLADLAAGVGGVGVDRGVAGGGKGFGGGVGDCEGDEFAAVPMRGSVMDRWTGPVGLQRTNYKHNPDRHRPARL